MNNYFIRWEAPWSRAYKKYSVVKLDEGYAIKVKPSWWRYYIFDSSTLGEFHSTEEEAYKILHILAEKYAKNYIIEWKDKAEKPGSKMAARKFLLKERKEQEALWKERNH